jgi:hypothetical protein
LENCSLSCGGVLDGVPVEELRDRVGKVGARPGRAGGSGDMPHGEFVGGVDRRKAAGHWHAFGAFDGVILLEAPDSSTAASVGMAIGAPASYPGS